MFSEHASSSDKECKGLVISMWSVSCTGGQESENSSKDMHGFTPTSPRSLSQAEEFSKPTQNIPFPHFFKQSLTD